MTAKQITQLRHDLNLTQREFAAKLGISLRSYQKWEQEEGGANHRTPRGTALTLLHQYVQIAKERKARMKA